MKTVNVCTHRDYNVLIGSGLIANAGNLIYDNIYSGKDAASVNVTVVMNSDLVMYSDNLVESLKAKGFIVRVLEVPMGEESKNFLSAGFILNHMASINFSRDDLLISFGGGSVGDVVGFCASIYKRGTYLVHIPTTLLAMVDSAIGGKTAINYNSIKNLVGSFYQPMMVIEDTDLLATVEGRNLRSGMGELIKYGVIDKHIFYKLYTEVDAENVSELIRDCVKVKADLVGADEFNEESRQVLELGHTIGHAIETLSGFRTPHGIAVACGIMCIARCMDNAYGTQSSEKIKRVMDIQGILTDVPFSADDILKVVANDKKWAYGKLSVVVFDDIGRCRIQEFTAAEFEKFIRGGLSMC